MIVVLYVLYACDILKNTADILENEKTYKSYICSGCFKNTEKTLQKMNVI